MKTDWRPGDLAWDTRRGQLVQVDRIQSGTDAGIKCHPVSRLYHYHQEVSLLRRPKDLAPTLAPSRAWPIEVGAWRPLSKTGRERAIIVRLHPAARRVAHLLEAIRSGVVRYPSSSFPVSEYGPQSDLEHSLEYARRALGFSPTSRSRR